MAKDGILNFNLRGLNEAVRTASLDSPLGTAALFGTGLALAGYHAGPWLTKKFVRLVSPQFSRHMDNYEQYLTPEDIAEQRKTWGWAGGILGAMATLGYHFSPNAPGYGLLKYPSLSKNESAEWNSLPIGQCMKMIEDNHALSPTMKMQSMSLLNSFNAPSTTQITGGNLVGQAIATGQSAAAGMAVGYLTASLLGLPNPSSTAILGAVANTLGPKYALLGSTVFGH